MRMLVLAMAVGMGSTGVVWAEGEIMPKTIEPQDIIPEDAAARAKQINEEQAQRKVAIAVIQVLLRKPAHSEKEKGYFVWERRATAMRKLGQLHAVEALDDLLGLVEEEIPELHPKDFAEDADSYPARNALVMIGKPASARAMEFLARGAEAKRAAAYVNVIERIEGVTLGRALIKHEIEMELEEGRKKNLEKALALLSPEPSAEMVMEDRVARVITRHGGKVIRNGLPAGTGAIASVTFKYDGDTADGFEYLKELKQLKLVDANYCFVESERMAGLEGCAALEELEMRGSQLIDRELLHIKGLTQLTSLGLSKTAVTGEGLKHLKELGKLKNLSLYSAKLTDEGLENLEALTELRRLDLGWNPITDAGIAKIKGLKQLERLNIESTRITDAGLVHVKEMAGIADLSLMDLPITDEGIEHLIGLKKLRSLNLIRTKVTDAGIAKLTKALPKCEILH